MTHREKFNKNKAEILAEYEAGEKTTQQIATEFKIGRKSLYRFIKELDIIRKYRKNLIGKTYGRLKVIRYVGLDDDRSNVWECVCECGNKKFCSTKLLNSKAIRSCGCLRSDNMREKVLPKSKTHRHPATSESLIRHVLCSYIARSLEKKFEFDLDIELFSKLLMDDCYYCGSKPASIKYNKSKTVYIRYNGIDRIDNSQGYTKANSITCCVVCNRAKSTMSQTMFKDWVRQIYKRFILNNNG